MVGVGVIQARFRAFKGQAVFLLYVRFGAAVR